MTLRQLRYLIAIADSGHLGDNQFQHGFIAHTFGLDAIAECLQRFAVVVLEPDRERALLRLLRIIGREFHRNDAGERTGSFRVKCHLDHSVGWVPADG